MTTNESLSNLASPGFKGSTASNLNADEHQLLDGRVRPGKAIKDDFYTKNGSRIRYRAWESERWIAPVRGGFVWPGLQPGDS